uniref:RNA-directed DNA polymerase, eukaryota, reverse transcriptase zinc-binding domain protein n=1 Tax=Tanacetum cinerariifolium TaxID=118510 RepID=A0A699SSK9_TANCI|nr:hypothetical protein [Tanacetum cinerariifolium]
MLPNGDCVMGEQVPAIFIDHYGALLGQRGSTSLLNNINLFRNQLSHEVIEQMVGDVSDKEIRDAIFSMRDDKSPGRDGYSAAFFKDVWDIVAQDVIKAVREFFVNDVLLKEVNHTIIALIPKVATPLKIND